jgi:hypothetical protein
LTSESPKYVAVACHPASRLLNTSMSSRTNDMRLSFYSNKPYNHLPTPERSAPCLHRHGLPLNMDTNHLAHIILRSMSAMLHILQNLQRLGLQIPFPAQDLVPTPTPAPIYTQYLPQPDSESLPQSCGWRLFLLILHLTRTHEISHMGEARIIVPPPSQQPVTPAARSVHHPLSCRS